MRKFRRRRQGAGLVLLMSLVIIVLGITLFFRTESSQRTSEPLSVDRVAVPMISDAPEAVAGQSGKSSHDGGATTEKGAKEGDKNQQAAAEQPAIPVPATNDLWVTIPRLGLYDVYVANSDAESVLDYGLGKRADSGFPWQNDANTYIVGHRLGWPGTGSDHIFYSLPSMSEGDEIVLYDSLGQEYTYRVSEVFAVTPFDLWVTESVPGRDMITLQVCTETPDDWWTIGPSLMSSGPESGRLMVRGDLGS